METSHNLWLVHAVGDRDADGDDELLDLFYVEGRTSTSATDVALASGTRKRLSDTFSFPESEVVAAAPNGRFPGESHVVPSHDASEELRFIPLSRLAWATLYERVFDIDPLACSSCG